MVEREGVEEVEKRWGTDGDGRHGEGEDEGE